MFCFSSNCDADDSSRIPACPKMADLRPRHTSEVLVSVAAAVVDLAAVVELLALHWRSGTVS